jgi:dTDP-4-amino-4,6-dideoxygalactose transaminase
MAPGEAYRAYRDEIDAALQRVMGGGWYILGDEVRRFEAEFAAWCGLDHMIGVANGTDAIEIALRTLEIGAGDIVVTVSHTAVATVAAIELVGATPVLVDIDPATCTIDPQKLDETVRDLVGAGLNPRAVIAVHLYGQPCDMPALVEICRRHDLLLVEDCAQAHGARIGGRHVGADGAASTFSFYPTKNLGAFGDGGAVGFMDAELARRCRALREYGWRERYISDLQGMNSRLDELQAALLSVRLAHLDAELVRRRAVAALYDRGLDGVTTPVSRPGTLHAYHLYVVRTPRREALRQALSAGGIGTGIHYPVPVHLQPAYANRIRIGAGGMAETERAAHEVLSLPMHGFLDDRSAARVIEAVRRAGT